MRVYLDTSALNRPFDDQTQPRIWLESMAVFVILAAVAEGDLLLVTSSVLEYERSRDPSEGRRRVVAQSLGPAVQHVTVTSEMEQRAERLAESGLSALDALHLAAAEAGDADCFITCDDRLLQRSGHAKVQAMNPLEFVRVFKGGGT